MYMEKKGNCYWPPKDYEPPIVETSFEVFEALVQTWVDQQAVHNRASVLGWWLKRWTNAQGRQ